MISVKKNKLILLQNMKKEHKNFGLNIGKVYLAEKNIGISSIFPNYNSLLYSRASDMTTDVLSANIS